MYCCEKESGYVTGCDCGKVGALRGLEPNHLNIACLSAHAVGYDDQFAPYKVFGNQMDAELDGTIFRLPLRTEEHAAASRISQRSCTLASVEHLIREFADMLSEVALFLTHIHTIEVHLPPELAYFAAEGPLTPELRRLRAGVYMALG